MDVPFFVETGPPPGNERYRKSRRWWGTSAMEREASTGALLEGRIIDGMGVVPSGGAHAVGRRMETTAARIQAALPHHVWSSGPDKPSTCIKPAPLPTFPHPAIR